MFLEVQHDHRQFVLSALKYSLSSTICDKICIVSLSGDRVFTNFSFISLFSKLVYSIGEMKQEEIPELIVVPLKLITIKNLILLLSEGKLVSNNVETLKDVMEAAKIFYIETRAWSIDIEDKVFDSENEKLNLVNEPLVKIGFSKIDWMDCEIKTEDKELTENVKESKWNFHENLSFLQSQSVCVKLKGGRPPKKIVTGKRGRPRKNASGRRGRPRKNVILEQFLCPECPKESVSAVKFKAHFSRNHTGRNSFKCGRCFKKFKSKYGLQYHVLSSHEEPSEVKETCDDCGEIFVGSGKTVDKSKISAEIRKKIHMEMFHGDTKEVWVCFICHHKFCQLASFDEHVRKSHPNTANDGLSEKTQCSHAGCGKVFSNKKSRIFHEKTHDPENSKFQCDVCDMKFVQKSTLKVHQEVHNPWRKCEECGKKMQSKQKFNVHIQRCRNEFRFQCDTCGKKFAMKWKLDKHTAGHSGIKPYSCEPCGKTFSWKGYLQTHLRREVCRKNRSRIQSDEIATKKKDEPGLC